MGVPTVTFCSTAFSHAARKWAAGRGLEHLPVVEIPHPMHSAPNDALSARAQAVVAQLVAALAACQNGGTSAVASRLPDLIELDANPAAIEAFFFGRGWSKGLPIRPPTRVAVEAMLACKPRDRHDALGPIPPAHAHRQRGKIAIHEVMTDCEPEYFPVVPAAVEAVLDESCRLYGIQTAANNTTLLMIINDPAIQRLNINAAGNV